MGITEYFQLYNKIESTPTRTVVPCTCTKKTEEPPTPKVEVPPTPVICEEPEPPTPVVVEDDCPEPVINISTTGTSTSRSTKSEESCTTVNITINECDDDDDDVVVVDDCPPCPTSQPPTLLQV